MNNSSSPIVDSGEQNMFAKVQKKLKESPTLQQKSAVLTAFEQVLPHLNQEQLQQLDALLDRESTDFEALAQRIQESEQILAEQAQQDSLEVLKDAEQRTTELKTNAEEADKASADQLLDDFED